MKLKRKRTAKDPITWKKEQPTEWEKQNKTKQPELYQLHLTVKNLMCTKNSKN